MNSRNLQSVHPLKRIVDVVFVFTVLLFVRSAGAGDLNPPAGPIAPTQRTPIGAATTPGDADSLFQIASPGSYYLTGNITGVAAKKGIEIAASGVTLDLMGFDLLGVAGSLSGVYASIAVSNIAVVNGSVRNWGGAGVDLANATNTRVADLRASGNAFTAIYAGGGSTITNCSAKGNAGSGIYATGSGSTITNCSAVSNAFYGIYTSIGCTITNCSAYSNVLAGINAGPGNTIANCSAYSNTADGIFVNTGSTIANCSAYANSGSGIYASGGSTITNCTASSNTLDGIRVSTDCTVRGNTCDGNGAGAGDGAGIHATLDDNRIEGNTCTDADRGIDVDAAGNFITHNTCSGNTTNWDVVAGNACYVLNAVLNGAILGVAGGSPPGGGAPYDDINYSY